MSAQSCTLLRSSWCPTWRPLSWAPPCTGTRAATKIRNSQLSWIILALLGLLPLLTSDPRLPLNGVIRVLLGVAPFAGVIGFVTPMLVDRWSAGDPDRAGRAYALNVLGCILGPLVSGFVLLPFVGERVSMLLFVLPWFVVAASRLNRDRLLIGCRRSGPVIVGVTLAVFFLTKDYETSFPQREVLRDSTATVIATGTGMQKLLITNGVGMTSLSPITKMMAHLTLASLESAATQCTGHLLRNGNDVPIRDFLGDSVDCGGACAQRAASCFPTITTMARRCWHRHCRILL